MRTRGWSVLAPLAAFAAALSGCSQEPSVDSAAPDPGVTEVTVDAAGVTMPVASTDPSSGGGASDVDPEQVAACVEFVKVQAFVGDPAGIELWELAGQTDQGLDVQCRVLAESDPGRVDAMRDELERMQEIAADAAASTTLAPGCHSSYGGCLPIVTDVDCDGSGDGPVFLALSVVVYGDDEYDIDGDGDGLACEPGDR